MSKLTIILSVVLFASEALSANPKIYCSDDIIATIDENAAKVESNKNGLLNIINGFVSGCFAYDLNVQDSFPSRKRRNPGPPEVVFDGHRADVTYSDTLEDTPCREFLGEYGKESFNECKQPFWNFMSITAKAITEKFDAIWTYLDVTKRQLSNNNDSPGPSFSSEKSCREKVEEITRNVQIAEMSIATMLELAKTKYENVIGDLSYCIVVKDEHNESLFNEWYEACSYYIQK